jgi:hypothetical protein
VLAVVFFDNTITDAMVISEALGPQNLVCRNGSASGEGEGGINAEEVDCIRHSVSVLRIRYLYYCRCFPVPGLDRYF